MVSVSNISELKKALENGETYIKVNNNVLLSAIYLCTKVKNISSTIVGKAVQLNMMYITPEAAEAGVKITAIVCFTAISIAAILKSYDIEIDFRNGTIKVTKRAK